MINALISPAGSIQDAIASSAYQNNPFFQGLLDGYQTMDIPAGLTFGIVVVHTISGLGIKKPEAIAKNTVYAGLFSCMLMALIYLLIAIMGTQSQHLGIICENGGEALAIIAHHYFDTLGALILAATVTLACLKTAIGLTTSLAEGFYHMFPQGPSYKKWILIFTSTAFLIATLGLSAIIDYALPVLMFLYPLAITLIFLSLFEQFFHKEQIVYQLVTGCTFIAAFFDFLNALPNQVKNIFHIKPLTDFASHYLPFFDLGFGWVCPALTGLLIGVIYIRKKRKRLSPKEL